MKPITYKRISNTVTVFLLIAFFYILIVTLTGCESKSGKLNQTKPEKVVVLDRYLPPINATSPAFRYRVKRIEYGVIDIAYDNRLFEIGDTILYKYRQ